MGFWEDNLKQRIPEYYETGEFLVTYLEVCGEIFDELSDTIASIDSFKDYKKCPESRLALLAQRFNFKAPAAIPEDLMRGIMRDIAFINRTNGTIDSIKWVFKLLNWEVDYKFAWLPAPEKFEPRLRDRYPNEYLGETDEQDYSEVIQFTPKIGQPYRIGIENQTYHEDPNGEIIGHMKIGVNNVGITDANDQYTPAAIANLPTDASKLGVENFLYGDAETLANGTYMYGKSVFAPDGSEEYYRILGENYDQTTVDRTNVKVMSTPYLLIEINQQDYLKFTAPYVGEDGETYSYTESESFRITEILINYLLHQYVRPSHVRILSIAAELTEFDYLSAEETFEQVITSNPEIFADDNELEETETDIVTADPTVYPMTYGDIAYTYGAPTAHPVNSLSGITPPSYGDVILSGTHFRDTQEFDNIFSVNIPENVPFVGIVDESGEALITEDGENLTLEE